MVLTIDDPDEPGQRNIGAGRGEGVRGNDGTTPGAGGGGGGELNISPGRGVSAGAGGAVVGVGAVSNNFFIHALDEVSRADPQNIQEVGAAQLSLSTSYYQNVLDQAKRSFVAAIISAAIGLAFFIASVSIFLVRNDVRAGTVSAISGAVVELISGLNFWLYGRTASQMNFFHIRLEQTQKYLLANSLSTKLSGSNRETALMELIKQVSTSPVFDAKGVTEERAKREATKL